MRKPCSETQTRCLQATHSRPRNMVRPDEFTVGKNTKYVSGNPISTCLISNMVANVRSLLARISFRSLLEVGCGEGIILHHLGGHLMGKTVALDIDVEEVRIANRNVPFATCVVGSAYDLPFSDQSFDCVLCCEVLEHLEAPERALQEIQRVCASHCVLSVPNEPFWRILNMARGAYLSGLGNTPGHVNHWTAKGFRRLIGEYFEPLQSVTPIPWAVSLCRRRRDSAGRTLQPPNPRS